MFLSTLFKRVVHLQKIWLEFVVHKLLLFGSEDLPIATDLAFAKMQTGLVGRTSLLGPITLNYLLNMW